MAGAQEIKTRIKSIEETKKITNAMYMIASSKMRQAKADLAATEPYFFAQQRAVSRFIDDFPESHAIYFGKDKPSEEMTRGYIVITADKGLSGAYNHNILRLAEEELGKHDKTKLYVVGELGRQYFLNKKQNVDGTFAYTAQNPTMFRARRVADEMLEGYLQDELDEVYIVYTRMINSFRMDPVVFRLLPLNRGLYVKDETEQNLQYIPLMSFHSTIENVLDQLMPNVVSGYIYGAMVESFASEQNSRLMAMQTATDNANDMLHDLNIEYNRVRQAGITQQITEVVGGAKALKKKQS